jgi:hypothetical protein
MLGLEAFGVLDHPGDEQHSRSARDLSMGPQVRVVVPDAELAAPPGDDEGVGRPGTPAAVMPRIGPRPRRRRGLRPLRGLPRDEERPGASAIAVAQLGTVLDVELGVRRSPRVEGARLAEAECPPAMDVPVVEEDDRATTSGAQKSSATRVEDSRSQSIITMSAWSTPRDRRVAGVRLCSNQPGTRRTSSASTPWRRRLVRVRSISEWNWPS